jgi:hypothetical protein
MIASGDALLLPIAGIRPVFRAIPAADKLRWPGAMRRFLDRCLTPERRAVIERLRRGEP